jgi:hypothetical protein
MMGNRTPNGQFDGKKTIGMAYLNEGRGSYTLKIWTFINDKFNLVARRNDPSQYLIFTKDPNQNFNNSSKSFSNIVGHGTFEPIPGVIKLEFDLLDKPIYMNIYPEPTPISNTHEADSEAAFNQAA